MRCERRKSDSAPRGMAHLATMDAASALRPRAAVLSAASVSGRTLALSADICGWNGAHRRLAPMRDAQMRAMPSQAHGERQERNREIVQGSDRRDGSCSGMQAVAGAGPPAAA